VGDADGDLVRTEQGGRDDTDFRVDPGEDGIPDAVQILSEVERDEAARADAVEATRRAADPVGDCREDFEIELYSGVLDRLGIGESDLDHHVGQGVRRADVAVQARPVGLVSGRLRSRAPPGARGGRVARGSGRSGRRSSPRSGTWRRAWTASGAGSGFAGLRSPLSPTVTANVLLAAVGSFTTSNLISILTDGLYHTDTLGMLAFNRAFGTSANLGLGAAVTIALFAFALVVALPLMYLFRRRERRLFSRGPE